MNAAIYLRKSRAEEILSEDTQTLKRHHQLLREFAKTKNINIIKTYQEVVSGENISSRPKMIELLNDISSGIYEGVLCMDIDRLGRGGMSDQGKILETFKTNNTKIVTPRKTYDLNNEIDEEYTEFETFIARRELKLIKRRMQRGIKKSVNDGGFLPTSPFGYEKVKVNNIPSLKINPEESVFVKMIFDLYVNKSKGCQAISEIINKLGAKSKKGNKFNRSSILHILKNPVYIGKIMWNSQENTDSELKKLIDGIHPPIINKNIFAKAQKIIKSKTHPPYNDGKVSNIFAGIIKCAICGKLLQRRPNKNQKCEYLICTTKNCSSASRMDIIQSCVNKAIEQSLKNIKLNPTAHIKDKDIASDIKILMKKTENLEKQKAKINNLLEQEIYDVQTYLQRNKSVLNEIHMNNQAIKKLRSEIKHNTLKSKHCNEIALDKYHILDSNTKNKILKLLIKEIIYFNPKKNKSNEFKLKVKINAKNNL